MQVCGVRSGRAILLTSAAAGIAIGIELHLAWQIWLWLRTTGGSSNGIIRNSSKNWVWDTLKGAAGVGSTTMPLYVWRPMGSWWPNGTVFPPRRVSAISNYPWRNSRPTTGRGARLRPERHNDITLHRSRACGFVLRASCCGSLLAALFAASYVYNTVVLENRDRGWVGSLTEFCL